MVFQLTTDTTTSLITASLNAGAIDNTQPSAVIDQIQLTEETISEIILHAELFVKLPEVAQVHFCLESMGVGKDEINFVQALLTNPDLDWSKYPTVHLIIQEMKYREESYGKISRYKKEANPALFRDIVKKLTSQTLVNFRVELENIEKVHEKSRNTVMDTHKKYFQQSSWSDVVKWIVENTKKVTWLVYNFTADATLDDDDKKNSRTGLISKKMKAYSTDGDRLMDHESLHAQSSSFSARANDAAIKNNLVDIHNAPTEPDFLTHFPLNITHTANELIITSEFGVRGASGVIGALRREHDGMDFRVVDGESEVVAAHSGEVIKASQASGLGHVIVIAHPSNMLTLYAHLDQIMVSKFELVNGGDIIGIAGHSGEVAPHLHFEIMDGATKRINLPETSLYIAIRNSGDFNLGIAGNDPRKNPRPYLSILASKMNVQDSCRLFSCSMSTYDAGYDIFLDDPRKFFIHNVHGNQQENIYYVTYPEQMGQFRIIDPNGDGKLVLGFPDNDYRLLDLAGGDLNSLILRDPIIHPINGQNNVCWVMRANPAIENHQYYLVRQRDGYLHPMGNDLSIIPILAPLNKLVIENFPFPEITNTVPYGIDLHESTTNRARVKYCEVSDDADSLWSFTLAERFVYFLDHSIICLTRERYFENTAEGTKKRNRVLLRISDIASGARIVDITLLNEVDMENYTQGSSDYSLLLSTKLTNERVIAVVLGVNNEAEQADVYTYTVDNNGIVGAPNIFVIQQLPHGIFCMRNHGTFLTSTCHRQTPPLLHQTVSGIYLHYGLRDARLATHQILQFFNLNGVATGIPLNSTKGDFSVDDYTTIPGRIDLTTERRYFPDGKYVELPAAASQIRIDDFCSASIWCGVTYPPERELHVYLANGQPVNSSPAPHGRLAQPLHDNQHFIVINSASQAIIYDLDYNAQHTVSIVSQLMLSHPLANGDIILGHYLYSLSTHTGQLVQRNILKVPLLLGISTVGEAQVVLPSSPHILLRPGQIGYGGDYNDIFELVPSEHKQTNADYTIVSFSEFDRINITEIMYKFGENLSDNELFAQLHSATEDEAARIQMLDINIFFPTCSKKQLLLMNTTNIFIAPLQIRLQIDADVSPSVTFLPTSSPSPSSSGSVLSSSTLFSPRPSVNDLVEPVEVDEPNTATESSFLDKNKWLLMGGAGVASSLTTVSCFFYKRYQRTHNSPDSHENSLEMTRASRLQAQL